MSLCCWKKKSQGLDGSRASYDAVIASGSSAFSSISVTQTDPLAEEIRAELHKFLSMPRWRTQLPKAFWSLSPKTVAQLALIIAGCLGAALYYELAKSISAAIPSSAVNAPQFVTPLFQALDDLVATALAFYLIVKVSGLSNRAEQFARAFLLLIKTAGIGFLASEACRTIPSLVTLPGKAYLTQFPFKESIFIGAWGQAYTSIQDIANAIVNFSLQFVSKSACVDQERKAFIAEVCAVLQNRAMAVECDPSFLNLDPLIQSMRPQAFSYDELFSLAHFSPVKRVAAAEVKPHSWTVPGWVLPLAIYVVWYAPFQLTVDVGNTRSVILDKSLTPFESTISWALNQLFTLVPAGLFFSQLVTPVLRHLKPLLKNKWEMGDFSYLALMVACLSVYGIAAWRTADGVLRAIDVELFEGKGVPLWIQLVAHKGAGDINGIYLIDVITGQFNRFRASTAAVGASDKEKVAFAKYAIQITNERLKSATPLQAVELIQRSRLGYEVLAIALGKMGKWVNGMDVNDALATLTTNDSQRAYAAMLNQGNFGLLQNWIDVLFAVVIGSGATLAAEYFLLPRYWLLGFSLSLPVPLAFCAHKLLNFCLPVANPLDAESLPLRVDSGRHSPLSADGCHQADAAPAVLVVRETSLSAFWPTTCWLAIGGLATLGAHVTGRVAGFWGAKIYYDESDEVANQAAEVTATACAAVAGAGISWLVQRAGLRR